MANWDKECKESADVSYLAVPVNKCNNGKCDEGETNDNKECSTDNKCWVVYDNPEDIPKDFRFKKGSNCYDVRSLLHLFENNLNIYNYQTSPKYPADPYTGVDYTFDELNSMVNQVKKNEVPTMLGEFMLFGEKLIRDLFNNNKETLMKKYGMTNRNMIMANKFRAQGYRYLTKMNDRLVDITDRLYGMQAESVSWVTKKYIQDHRSDISVWYTFPHEIKKISAQPYNWTDMRVRDYWFNGKGLFNEKVSLITENDLRKIFASSGPGPIPMTRTRANRIPRAQESSIEGRAGVYGRRSLPESQNSSSRQSLPERQRRVPPPGQKLDCYRMVDNFANKNIRQGPLTFDNEQFDTDIFNEVTDIMAPKLKALLSKIKQLDRADQARDNKKYKHFIYSGFTHIGSKMIGSALLSNGYDLVYKINTRQTVAGPVRSLDYKEEKGPDRFGLLSSKKLYDLSVSKTLTKKIISKFNERPKNINGDYMRFIVADSGFQEGVDLFDVKYVHIFEEQKTQKQYNQAIGRAIRRCGTVGLNFVPNVGWPIEIYNYKSQLDNGEFIFEQAMSFDNNAKFVINMHDQLEKVMTVSGVDYFVNNFPNDPLNETLPEPSLDMSIEDYQKAIAYKYKNYKISPRGIIKNECSKPEPGIKVVDLSKPQQFIQNFFTPESPLKGLLLQHSIGSGKTCTAIATASKNWTDKTILWVTKSTLTESFWKNVVDDVCEVNVTKKLDKLKRLKNPKTILSRSAWIPPVTYKQFSNILSILDKNPNTTKNDTVMKLWKRNGRADPLRNTLVIIDEAHQIYEMDSNTEKPNTDIIEKKLDESYKSSGKDSVKVLLLTATPLFGTEKVNQEKFFKLLNLIKINKLPVTFDEIKDKYFDNNGKFTTNGEKQFRNSVKGLISDLDIRKDSTQFALPVFKDINVPIVLKPELCSSLKLRMNAICKELKKDKSCENGFKIDSDNCKTLPTKDKKECNEKAKQKRDTCENNRKAGVDICEAGMDTDVERCKVKSKRAKQLGIKYTKQQLKKCK